MKFRSTMMATFIAMAFAPTADGAPARARMVETSPGILIRVVDSGSSEASLTIVLIPGWRFTADIWQEQIATLSKQYRVISLDPRSQGASTKATDGNTPEVRANDLHTILGKLNAGPVLLIGWSQGAQDVGAYVAKYGTADVRGLVFVDAAPSQGWEKAAASSGAAQQLRQISLYARYPIDATDGMMRAVFKTPRSPEELARLTADALKTPPTIGAAMLEDDLFGPDRLSPLSKADVPALLIAADASPNAADLAVLAKALPKAPTVQVFSGAGHAVFVDRPEAFDSAILSFARRVS